MESRTVWPLIVVDSRGRAYSVRVADLPGGRGDGVPLTTLIEFQDGAKLAQALTDSPDTQYLFANSGGYGFLASIADLVSRNRAGKAFMSLERGERPLRPARVAGDTVAAVSASGRLLLLPVAELRAMAKGRGLIVLDLAPQDELTAVAVGLGSAFTVQGIGRGGKVQEWRLAGKELAAYRGSRARKGQPITAKLKPTAIAADD
jgi:topoisomerase-4 subunit A